MIETILCLECKACSDTPNSWSLKTPRKPAFRVEGLQSRVMRFPTIRGPFLEVPHGFQKNCRVNPCSVDLGSNPKYLQLSSKYPLVGINSPINFGNWGYR